MAVRTAGAPALAIRAVVGPPGRIVWDTGSGALGLTRLIGPAGPGHLRCAMVAPPIAAGRTAAIPAWRRG
ncbi:MAG TPA: hypothetical protein GX405_10035 [Rhizobiales bacterium]|nr:hypothetical protein [Hyphomicrobiales bacterium]